MMADIFANCQWCKGRGCTFCPTERQKREQEAAARAQRRWEREGVYCAPDFDFWDGTELVMYSPPDWKPRVIKRDIISIDGEPM